MKKILIGASLAVSFSVAAQTKLISFKSHSGKSADFGAALSSNLLNDDSNLGMAPTRRVTNASLDSVIFLDSKRTVLVTSEYCKMVEFNKNIFGDSTLWKPGRDTVYSHPIFSSRNIDSVRRILKSDYHFKNDMDKVIFLKQRNSGKLKQISPNKIPKSNRTPISENGYLLGVLLISGLAGAWKWKQDENND